MKRIKLQRDYQDCGVACLSYLIEYYHGYVPFETLREETSTNIQGTTAYDLVKTLKKYHFDAYGMRIKKEDIKNLRTPFIAHLILKNGLHHFVVVVGVSSKKIEIMDPARGRVKYSYADFFDISSLVVIVASPYQAIPCLKKEKKFWHYYFQLLKKYHKIIFLLILFEIFYFGLQTIHQFYVKIVGQNTSNSSFFLISLYFGVLLLLQVLFFYGKEKLKLNIEKNMDEGFMKNLLSHLLRLPLKKYNSYHEGEILKRIEEAEELKQFFSLLCGSFFLDFLFSLVAMVLFFFFHYQLALGVMIGFIFYLVLQFVFSPFLSKFMKNHIENETNWKESVLEGIYAIPSLKHNHAIEYGEEKLHCTLSNTISTRFHLQKKLLLVQFIKSTYLQIFSFGFTFYCLYFVLTSRLSMLDFITLQNLYLFLIKPFLSLEEIVPRLYYYRETYEKISEYLVLQEEKEDKKSLSFSSVDVHNLCFSYYHQKDVLHHLSFRILEGEHVFLTGKSGSGKSTLCKILTSEMTDFSGDVYLGSFPIKKLSSDTIYQNITYLGQREQFLIGSIKENVLFGLEDHSNRFDEVCRICRLDLIVDQKPMKYDTTIQSQFLSGGEKERVLLARALYRTSNIYILDEPLSSVERSLEEEIVSSLKHFLRGKTLIYISHRNVQKYFNKVIRIP